MGSILVLQDFMSRFLLVQHRRLLVANRCGQMLACMLHLMASNKDSLVFVDHRNLVCHRLPSRFMPNNWAHPRETFHRGLLKQLCRQMPHMWAASRKAPPDND